ncbi:MAG: hypothetical protein R6V06_06905 [Kiritimatiellia bacterium]
MGSKNKNRNNKKKARKTTRADTEKKAITLSEPAEQPIEKISGSDKTASPSDSKDQHSEKEKHETEHRGKKRSKAQVSAVENKINRDIKTRSRLRKMLPDIIRVGLAFTVIGLGVAIWWKPPLLTATFPVTTFRYKNQPVKKAALFRPLAMRERYYVKLPEKLENRYQWFAIDRRREVVALSKKPQESFFGKTAIKRADSLGLDLEFRTIDGHEWRINFYSDAIVFSNNLLCVRLDTKKAEQE